MSDDPRTPIKAMLWEEAKGKLRALAAVQGSYESTDTGRTERWQKCEAVIEDFITAFEDYALQE